MRKTIGRECEFKPLSFDTHGLLKKAVGFLRSLWRRLSIQPLQSEEEWLARPMGLLLVSFKFGFRKIRLSPFALPWWLND